MTQRGREPPPLENEPPVTISTAEVGHVIDETVMQTWHDKMEKFYRENFSPPPNPQHPPS